MLPERRASKPPLGRVPEQAPTAQQKGDYCASLTDPPRPPASQTGLLPERIPRYRVGGLRAIALAQAKAGDAESSRKTFAQAKSVAETIPASEGFLKILHFREIAKAQVLAGDVAGAKSTAQASSDSSERAGRLRAVAEAQAQAGDMPGAKASAAEIGDNELEIKAKALVDIAGAEIAVGNVVGARGTLAQAKSVADANKNPAERATTLLYIVETMGRVGDFEAAKDVAIQIGPASPNKELAAQVDAADKQPMSRGGREMLGKVAALVAAMPEPSLQAKALRVIGELQARSGDIAGAKSTAEVMGKGSGKDDLVRAIAEAQVRVGDSLAAKTWATSISDSYFKNKVLSAIGQAQAEAGDLAGARGTAEAIKGAPSDKAAVFCAIALAQARAGDQPGAEASIGGVGMALDPEDRCDCFIKIADALLKSTGKPRGATVAIH